MTEARKRTAQDFKILDEIGEGSYSSVVHAIEKDTQIEYAIKILNKRHIVKEKKEKYVKVEKDALSLLKHPLIVRLYYTFQDSSSLCIYCMIQFLDFVLDYAKNGDLLQLIKNAGKFSVQVARFYAAEILLAIEYMHSRDIIHSYLKWRFINRDLKPENILVMENGHIKVTDFGTARILETSDRGRAFSFVGTAEYVAPELLTIKEVTKSADLWAFGCIIYQMLTGIVPFKGGSEYLTFEKIKSGEYSFSDDFPEEAKSLVQLLLVADPIKRIGSDESDYKSIKNHQFFNGIDWDTIINSDAPEIEICEEAIDGVDELPFKDLTIQRVMNGHSDQDEIDYSKWEEFLIGKERILKVGLVKRKKKVFSSKRYLVLTDTPRLFYVDVSLKISKQIKFNLETSIETQKENKFTIDTGHKKYCFEDLENKPGKWVSSIQSAFKK
ncbi:Protein kinase, catalytic domain-containing protein [Rozella allomycis CSF55]|uniref:non-specific serine/threonine protein kinase n=1 Tax=Rozella allomycis (strain CSF55) TaxID=988480 RepID=A0A075ARW4_ROZAC|nr:Protein kinase, catalytic domain-containing protein [Rozella allomycis CSF55]|eukprot:EPZ31456.1 Protein kinase, catalytic domain-containing protein [Rozella allomycis CSF55]